MKTWGSLTFAANRRSMLINTGVLWLECYSNKTWKALSHVKVKMVKSCHILKYFYTLFQTWQLESQVVTICSHVYKPYASVSKLLFQLASNTDLSEVLHFQLTANLQFELLTTLTYPHTLYAIRNVSNLTPRLNWWLLWSFINITELLPLLVLLALKLVICCQ